MKNLSQQISLECMLDNPLSPTLATLHIPRLYGENPCEMDTLWELIPKEEIRIEIQKTDQIETVSLGDAPLKLNKVGQDRFLLKVKDDQTGLEFSVHFNQFGQVKRVQAAWV